MLVLSIDEEVTACGPGVITARRPVRLETGGITLSKFVQVFKVSYVWDSQFPILHLHTVPSFFLMAAFSLPMQVTITLLPVSLSLVHVPRSRLAQLSHPIIRQILQPQPTFLNLTCNEIELSLFAEHHVLADFEPIARNDRRRRRSRSGSGSSRKTVSRGFLEPVEISYEKWNVLQIDSHSDQLGVS
jgi:hypothetical protein